MKTELAPALRERIFLVSALQQGIITRADPAWQPFDAACAQIQAAEQRITRAEEAVKYAHQRHDLRPTSERPRGGSDAGRAGLAGENPGLSTAI